MNFIEHSIREFHAALNNICESSPPFSGIAQRITQGILNHEITLMVNSAPYRLKTPTVFSIRTIPSALREEPFAVIIIDPSVIDTINLPTLMADTVRTLAIADQFPENGYERKLATVYEQALDVQENWLDNPNTSQILMNPDFKQYRARRIQYLIGEEDLIFDIGWDEWQRTVEKLLQDKSFTRDRYLLEILRNSKSEFVAQRHIQQPYILRSLNALDSLKTQPEEDRVEIACRRIINAALNSKRIIEN